MVRIKTDKKIGLNPHHLRYLHAIYSLQSYQKRETLGHLLH